MEGTDETSMGSSLFTNRHKQLEIPNLNVSHFGAIMSPSSQNVGPENNKKIPIINPPYLQIAIPAPAAQQHVNQNIGLGNFHSRSSSQPPLFSMNSLPPLSPLPNREPPSMLETMLADGYVDEKGDCCQGPALNLSLQRGNSFQACESLPTPKGHRRSSSDLPLGFSDMIQSSPQLIPISGQGVLGRSVLGRDHFLGDKTVRSVKLEPYLDRDCISNLEGMGERKSEGEVLDDLFKDTVNLENVDPFNSSGTGDKDMDSRASGTQTHGGDINDNEVESNLKGNPNNMNGAGLSFAIEKRHGVKMDAVGEISLTARHFRSISMDSFMENMDFSNESLKIPLSLGTGVGSHSPSNSLDGNSVKFSLEFGNGEFSGLELKKIMANEKLAEIALSDPKRAKRILANRQSAARSKERKMRHISELEHKVLTLQAEATTLSTQLKVLQGESAGLANQNNELKFRLQAMEQQAQLRDALNEALAMEVQHLKLTTGELRGDVTPDDGLVQQNSMTYQLFGMQN
ncbi:Basic-leucine zipper (bZIP) transcription factor family protein [Actinidia rufa]|uniref:Basic-leucine zipper (BZIP) transcription factor family protein n=1 Tax=Actinidia rufa TaxID=165716 RepID=A0A7J0EIH1_9ERIC|nr:Basic-leucine zipper (bZIP) transcription factor family protein [Actinidia rufa]